jgi:hypothetical protein
MHHQSTMVVITNQQIYMGAQEISLWGLSIFSEATENQKLSQRRKKAMSNSNTMTQEEIDALVDAANEKRQTCDHHHWLIYEAKDERTIAKCSQCGDEILQGGIID